MSVSDAARAPSTAGDLSPFVSYMSYLVPDDIMSSGWLEHGPFAFWLTKVLTPRRYVELGTHNGYSYFVMCQAVRKLNLSTTCYAVDTWKGDEHAGYYDDAVFQSVERLNDKYNSFSTLVRSTFDEALKYFQDESIDLLHIDGRHFYEDVKCDFEMWLPKLTEDAIVIFHDTNVRERDFGVWKFFDELKQRYATFEFMHGHGLGVLAINQIPNSLRDLFACSINEASNIRFIYSNLGASITQRWLAEHGRRETKRVEGELKRLLEIHQGICDAKGDVEQQRASLHNNNAALQLTNNDLKNEVEVLRLENDRIKQNNSLLQGQIDQLRNKKGWFAKMGPDWKRKARSD